MRLQGLIEILSHARLHFAVRAAELPMRKVGRCGPRAQCGCAVVKTRVTAALRDGTLESVTCNLTMLEDGNVGVPVICPVAPLRLNPAGNRPEVMVQKYGGVPPMA
jgi:hypothetical protein